MELTHSITMEYLANWRNATVLPSWQEETDLACDKIVANKIRYSLVAKKTGVPWHVIACIHGMESDFDFGTHLHNGDSLQDYTYHVPAGRPHVGHKPPFAWTESAVDAMNLDGFNVYHDWSIAGTLFALEKYNGWGYRAHPGHLTQYLWSGTSVGTRGKYIADNVWSNTAKSDQIGCVPMWKELERRGELVTIPKPVATWIDIQKDTNGTVLTAYAVSTPVEQIRTNDKEAILSFLLHHPDAHNVLVAPSEKQIPAL